MRVFPLLMLEREGQGTHLVKINVRQILSGIESESQRRENGSNVTNIYVGRNVDGNMVVGDENDVVYRDDHKKKRR